VKVAVAAAKVPDTWKRIRAVPDLPAIVPVRIPELSALMDPSAWIISDPEPTRVPPNVPCQISTSVKSITVLPSAVRVETGESVVVSVPPAGIASSAYTVGARTSQRTGTNATDALLRRR
jgi:hypothetical protein